jgi:hypothetical protein
MVSNGYHFKLLRDKNDWCGNPASRPMMNLTYRLLVDNILSNSMEALSVATKRYHIYKDQAHKQRTTVSLDSYVSKLLILKLGYTPDVESGHGAVRQWLQDQLDDDVDPDRVNTSQWLQGKAVLEIADKKLSKKYWDWRIEKLD